jgi:hypothetical protein
MPEIEELKCDIDTEESTYKLKRYLETHTQLKKLSIWLKSAIIFPAISLDAIHIELSSFSIQFLNQGCSHLNNHAIDFIKSQAKSLKILYVNDFIYDLDMIQDLFDGMEKLETVNISGKQKLQTTEFVERNFECPKIKELTLGVENFEYFGFFRKFPNLKNFHCWRKLSGFMVNTFIQNCRQITKLFIWDFDEAFQNATFPILSELAIRHHSEGYESSFEGFLARHQKLKELKFYFKFYLVKKEILLKLPALLPNVDDFEFYQFDGFDENDLKNLLASWNSIKILTINSYGQRKLDLEAATKDIHRRLTICQYTGAGTNILIK